MSLLTEYMNSLQFLGGFETVISVFQVILVQQNYRTVNFYRQSSLNDDVFDRIIRVASDSLTPFRLRNMNEIGLERKLYDEPILNIVVVSDLRFVKESLAKNCLYETTVIWSTSENDEIYDNMTQWFKISSKVIVLTNSSLYTLNNFLETKFDGMSLTNFSSESTRQFLANFFSIESIRWSNLTILTEFNAPRSELTRIDENYYMIGPDGILAEALVKSLNFKPKFLSSVTTKSANYKEWITQSILSLRLRYQWYHSAVLTKNVIENLNHNDSNTYDVQLTAFPHLGRNFTDRLNISSETLFPHDRDCLAVIVPQQELSNNFLRKVVSCAHTKVIGFALLLFVISRIFLQKGSWHRGFKISFDTIGVVLNQKQISNDNQVKVAWDINLRVFSLLATTTLSAIIFKSIIAPDSNEINTIDDLLKSNLTIYAPNWFNLHDTWGYLRPSLLLRLVFITPNQIERNLVDEQKFNFAYIYPKSKGDFITMLANSKVQAGSRHRVRYMEEYIHHNLASYRASENSPLTPYLNLFMLRFMENGIYNKQLEWMKNLNEAVFQIKQNEPPKRENVVLTMKMVAEVFFVYLIGMGIAIVTFVIETFSGFYVAHFNQKSKSKRLW